MELHCRGHGGASVDSPRPGQASPGLWWFGIELPSLASGQHGKESLRTEGLGETEIALTKCVHFCRLFWEGTGKRDKDCQSAWLALQL